MLFPQYPVTVGYAGLGVILGHNYPIWHKFIGGKGVTCTCGALVCMSLGYGLLSCVIGLIGVLISHYLPIGAIMIPLAFIIPAFYLYGNEVGMIAIIMTIIMISRHMSGLKNIPKGKEPRKDLMKMIKDKL